MKLQEIFEQLAVGELCQLSIGGQPAGEINENNYAKLIPHVNLGLADLYKRFSIKESSVLLQLVPGMTHYRLASKFAVNGKRSQEPLRYLIDSVQYPFMDDLLKISKVSTDAGFDLSLNDGSNADSVSTPTYDALLVPRHIVDQSPALAEHLRTENLAIAYRANPVKIVVGMGLFDPSKVEVELPGSYLNALLLFIASRINNPIGMTGEFNAGNNYAAKYEQACQLLEMHGMDVDTDSQNTRLQRNGWV